jgi:hypothetical protein
LLAINADRGLFGKSLPQDRQAGRTLAEPMQTDEKGPVIQWFDWGSIGLNAGPIDVV